jgi:UPF0176 protein
MKYKVISFYRYVNIEYPEGLQEYLRTLCEDFHILGRILLGHEGINGAVSGTVEQIKQFQKKIKENPLFHNLTYREQFCEKNAYHKLVVRVRDEICVFGKDVDLAHTGNHLEPKELKRWYDSNEDFVIVDARNTYEYKVGHFKDAIKLPIQNFSEFGDVAPQQLVAYKNKKVVLYCTGGIRCEKASAYLIEQGFEHVHQVNGGIINYVNQFKEYWEGGLFVFDDRLISEQENALTRCVHCNELTQKMADCFHVPCDTLFVVCDPCKEEMHNCCSEACKTSPQQRKFASIDDRAPSGVVENYYAQAGVALVKLHASLSQETLITIRGKTTPPFSFSLDELRDDAGDVITSAESGQVVTFPVKEKIRKNDKVFT